MLVTRGSTQHIATGEKRLVGRYGRANFRHESGAYGPMVENLVQFKALLSTRDLVGPYRTMYNISERECLVSSKPRMETNLSHGGARKYPNAAF